MRPLAHFGWWIFYMHAIVKDNFVDIVVDASTAKAW
jgi:hypothetical protein